MVLLGQFLWLNYRRLTVCHKRALLTVRHTSTPEISRETIKQPFLSMHIFQVNLKPKLCSLLFKNIELKFGKGTFPESQVFNSNLTV